MKILHAMAAAAFTAAAGAAHADEGGAAILVLDASGSMRGQVAGRPKIELAREAADALVRRWPADQALGVVAYGHRRKGDCADIELLQPVAAPDAAGLRTTLAAIKPAGMTPISAAVRFAAEQLGFAERKATVILVSDGEETCQADPCALGAELEKSGVDFTAHVVGFDLPAGPAREQLQCLARATGGRYVEARDAAGLGEALGALGAATFEARTGGEWMPDVGLVPETLAALGEPDAGGTETIAFTNDKTARDCQALCQSRASCAAWTYEPSGTFFVDHPRCALKGRGFGMRVEKMERGEGWVSGVKPGVELLVE